MSQFQLFPPSAPQGPPKNTNPFRRPKGPSISTQPTASIPLDDLSAKSTEAKAVVFQFVEPDGIKPPPRAHIPPLPSTSESRQFRSSPQYGERVVLPANEIGPKPASAQRSIEGIGPQPVQSPTERSVSPAIPMRSIFPQYNPETLLSHQEYFNGISDNVSSRSRPRPPELSLSPPPEIDRVLGPKTVPASVLDFPTGILDQVEIAYSSPAELKSLWEAANGQRPANLSRTFNLKLERLDSATFAFGDPHSPFYTMQTYSTNELSLSRANPSIPNSNIPIMMLQLEDRRRREPPNDGLVTHLFSRLAAMLAIDQAEDLPRQRRLTLQEAKEVEATALKRAAAQESCRLSWNASKRLYELRNPSLKKLSQSPSPLIGAAGIPLSPALSSSSVGTTDVLHITISTPSPTPTSSSSSRQHLPPTILVTNPHPAINPLDPDTSPPATARTSTLPQLESETDEPLASLDLSTMTLSIAPSTITNTIPSLYAIDSVVAALLAVAVSDIMTNPVLGDMALYTPPDVQQAQAQYAANTSPTPTPYGHGHGHEGRAAGRPKLVATIAEREDAHAHASPSPYSSPPQPHSQTQTQTRHHRKWFSFSIPLLPSKFKPHPKPKPKTNPLTTEEIDLEKYGISPSTARNADAGPKKTKGPGGKKEKEKEEEDIPGLARGAIKLMSWGFKLVVFGLMVAFKVLSWVLVRASRCVGGDK